MNDSIGGWRCLVVLAAFGASAVAQCGEWSAHPADPGGIPGIDQRFGFVAAHDAVLWDADGAGPGQALAVIGGDLSIAGQQFCGNLAAYDAATRTFSDVGANFNAAVHSVLGLASGELIAGGDFFTDGATFFSSIARYDGVSWGPLAAGLNDRVAALVALPNGDVIAGGYFTASGGVPMSRVARWNGSSWSALGVGLDGAVEALTIDASGALVAAGSFQNSGFVSCPRIARWDGSTWSAIGGGATGPVLALQAMPNGDLIGAGQFASIGGVAASNIARWDGAMWHAMGGGANARVDGLAVAANGDLIAAGRFTAMGGLPVGRVARWDTTQWSDLGGGVELSGSSFDLASVALTLPGGDLLVAGEFDSAGGTPVVNCARYDGSAWLRSNDGMDGKLTVLHERANGRLVVGGTFATIGGVVTDRIVEWDGAGWQALGGGLPTFPAVRDVVELSNGDLVAAAGFVGVGGGADLKRFDGSTWSAMSGITGRFNAMAVLPGGDAFLVVGSFQAPTPGGSASNVARWDGSAWQSLGAGTSSEAFDVAVSSAGEVVVCGSFAGSEFLRWDGAAWLPMGQIPGAAVEVIALADGSFVARSNSFRTYRWDGASWVDLGQPLTSAFAIAPLPDGDLFAHGNQFVQAGFPSVPKVERWDGSGWSSLLSPFGSYVAFESVAAPVADGVLASGSLAQPDGRMVQLSQFRSTCPAGSTVIGAGCAGSAGVVDYAVTKLPWIGGDYRAQGSQLPSNAVAIQVVSLAASISAPIPAVLQPASPACLLFAQPDYIAFQAASGEVLTSLAVPDAAALVGATLVDQLVILELDASGILLQSASSNGLAVTIGAL